MHRGLPGWRVARAAGDPVSDWCNCQAIRGTINYPGPWHPKGDPAGCQRCAICVADGTHVDEVSGMLFCADHAGPLAWSDCKVNAYTIAVRVAGHYDVPVTDAWTVAA